jgi:predicted GTPase
LPIDGTLAVRANRDLVQLNGQRKLSRLPDTSENYKVTKKLTEIEKAKLVRLSALAKQGFDELDRGFARVLKSEKELREHIAKLGRKTPKNKS